MANLKETAAEIAYRIAMHDAPGYGALKSIAKSSGHRAPEVLGQCKEHGINAGHFTATTPLNPQYKLGIASPPKREPKVRTVSGAGMEFPSAEEREEWARGPGSIWAKKRGKPDGKH